MSVPGAWYLVLAAILFGIGATGLLLRRNVLVMFMCVELMLNAVSLTFVTYARLLNDGGEFVAEVPLGEDGGFRFFAAPGTWTVRVLAPGGVRADQTVTAGYGRRTALEVSV